MIRKSGENQERWFFLESDSAEERVKWGVFRDMNGTMIHLHNILEI